MRKRKKILAFVMSAVVLATTVLPLTYTALASDTTAALTDTTAQSQGSEEDLCYISGLQIKSMTDGSEPFDADDSAGNDSSGSNGIVRSFDEVNYSLEYVTAIRDTSGTGIDEGYVEVKFVLPCSAKTAVFNESTMNWCLNRKITYFYSDGTSGTTLDRSKEVIRQELTGERYLVNSDAGNAIPGTGTLSVGLKVQAAENNAQIQPEFYLWMKGNSDADIQSLSATPVRVSAAPKYNFVLASDEGLDYLGYFNETTGQIYGTKEDNTSYGRLIRYALVMQLYNDNASKGLKGIEMPDGDVTFDISIKAELDGVVQTNTDFRSVLWDYIENGMGVTGHNGRVMAPNTAGGYAYYGPSNKNLNRSETACYDGGNFKIVQDANDSSIYHCTISDYQIDYEKMHFPVRYLWSNEGNVTYGQNVGCISSANIEILSTFPEVVNTQQTLCQDVQIINTKVTSSSGQSGQNQVTGDDHVRKNVTLYPIGSVTRYQRFTDTSGNFLATVYYAGDNASYPGKNIKIESFIHGRSEFSYESFSLLQKFDDEFLVPTGDFTYYSSYMKDPGTVSMLFAAKPDKTGWTSDDEMNAAVEEDLVYFKTIDELQNAGYTCVAVLYEIRGAESVPVTSYITYYDLYVGMKVKTDASIMGKVCQTVSNLRAWRKDRQTMPFSWTDYQYNGNKNIFGNGGQLSGYVDGYVTPYSTINSNNYYQKVSYVDGVMYGHNGYNYGNSLLIIGNNVGVTITGADKENGSTKTVYDLDAGERTATFNINPTLKVDSANSGITSTDMTDNVTVTAKLPKGLHYNTSGKDPESVTENSDGTTTVVWKYENVSVKDTVPTLPLSVTIGEEGTVNDVSNNDKFVIGVSVQSDNDKRAALLANGKYSETSITVIKLAASAVTERVVDPLVELGEDITFRMRYSNLSDVSADAVKMYNILPENGDSLGSSFSGSYKITGIKIDFTNAQKTLQNYASSMTFYSTADNSGKTKALMESTLKNGTISSIFQQAAAGTLSGNYMEWNKLSMQDITALIFGIDHVFGNEYLDIYITITPTEKNGASQKTKDLYKNNFTQYAQNQAEIVISNTAEAQVVQRVVNGTTWIDANKNGIRENTEQKLSGLTASIYSTKIMKVGDSAAYTIDGVSLYPVYDVYGNNVASTKTGLAGEYEFTNMKDGEYYIVFAGTEGYGLTTEM